MTNGRDRATRAQARREDQNKPGETIRSEKGRLDFSGGSLGDILVVGPGGSIAFQDQSELLELFELIVLELRVLNLHLAEVTDEEIGYIDL